MENPLDLSELPDHGTCSFPRVEYLKCKLDSLPHLPWNQLTLSLVSCQLSLSDSSGKLLHHWHVVVDLGCFSLALHNERKNQATGKDSTWKIQYRLGVKLKASCT